MMKNYGNYVDSKANRAEFRRVRWYTSIYYTIELIYCKVYKLCVVGMSIKEERTKSNFVFKENPFKRNKICDENTTFVVSKKYD